MIRQNWNIDPEEKKRILLLHEQWESPYMKRGQLGNPKTKKLKPGAATKDLMSLDTEQSDLPSGVPKNVRFRIPLGPKIKELYPAVNSRVFLDAFTDDNNNVYIILNGQTYRIPEFLEKEKVKFWSKENEYGIPLLEAVDEWEWLNEINDMLGASNEIVKTFFVPSYSRLNGQLSYFEYQLKAVHKSKVRGMTEAEDYISFNSNTYLKSDEGNFYIVWFEDPLIGLGRIPSGGGEKTIVPKEPIELDIQSPFIFDKTELTDEAKKSFEEFIEKIKQYYQGVSANVDVIASASIDGDPNQKLQNGMTRKDYDLDLSQRRAKEIANKLTSEVGISTLRFIPKGIGQTTAYGPGWTKESKTTPDQTAPNRRLIVKLPEITPK